MAIDGATPRALMASIGRVVEEAIAQHEAERHIPLARGAPLTAIPFPNISLSDEQTCRAIEMLQTGSSLHDAASEAGVPIAVLELALADYRPRWYRFLMGRASNL